MPTETSMEIARVLHDKLTHDEHICHDCFQREASKDICPVCTAVAQAIDEAAERGWDAACNAVADAVRVGSMMPPRASRAEMEDASMVVTRVRSLIEDVERRGPPKERTD